MASINKILDKISTAKEAVNSLKGVAAAIRGKNYTSATDALGALREKAKSDLEKRRKSIKALSKSGTLTPRLAKATPMSQTDFLSYPFEEELPNYIIFRANDVAGRNTDLLPDLKIKLYIPDGLNNNSSVTYETADIGAMAAAVATGAKGEDGSDNLTGVQGEGLIKNIAERFARQTGEAVLGDAGKLVNKVAGKAANPLRETFLKDVPFRTFNFAWQFKPKSRAEAQEVQRIITAFRLRMLPKTAENDLFLIYPPQWDVSFSKGIKDRIEGYLPGMVCTSMAVDYAGGQKFSAFADGYPTAVNLTIDFAETKILSRNNYEEYVGVDPKSIGNNIRDLI